MSFGENEHEDPASAWVRTAFLLTRDGDRALTLVATGMDTARRADPGPAPEAIVQATVRTWVSQKRSCTAAPAVVRLDDGPALTDDDLWTRLGALPKDQQAALVLRHHDGLTPAEVARLLNRDGADVAQLTEAADTALGHPDRADLAELMRTQAQDAPDPTELPGRVQRLQSRRRRLRLGALAVAAIVLLAAIAVPLSRTSRTLTGAGRVSPIAEATQYQNGGKLVGSASLDTGRTTKASVTFTPTAKPLFIATSCTYRGAQTSVTVNGRPSFSGDCGGGLALGANGQSLPFPLGAPVTTTLTVTSGGGLAQLAVYQMVPLSEYVFPPRPAKLAPPPSGPGPILADSAKLGANGRATVSLILTADTLLSVNTSAPGELKISVDGSFVRTVTSWDWTVYIVPVLLTPDDLARAGVEARAGQTVQVTLQASRFDVPGWIVAVLQ